MESAIPAFTIATLSTGDFVGMVANDPDYKIELKSFHCQILNDHQALKKGQQDYKPMSVLQKVDNSNDSTKLFKYKARGRRFGGGGNR